LDSVYSMKLRAKKTNAKVNYLRDGRAPVPKKESTSRVMSANRAKNTVPEVILKKELRKKKLGRPRYHVTKLTGRPDIIYSQSRLAVFVHGCFWHQCPRCRMPLPRTHQKFWCTKFARNRERDARKVRELKKSGWRTVVIWEHEIKHDASRAALRVERALE
jgi:DNA mismatch endonuclease, patch repair protein